MMFRQPPLDPEEHWRGISGLAWSDQLAEIPWRIVGLAQPHPQLALLARFEQGTWGEAPSRQEHRLANGRRIRLVYPTQRGPKSITLGYGRLHDRAAPVVNVTTEPSAAGQRTLHRFLLNEVVNDPQQTSAAVQDEWSERVPGREEGPEEPVPVSMRVDDSVMAGRYAEYGAWWAARCVRDEVVITVAGKGASLSELSLVTVVDLAPYMEGRVRYLQELREGRAGL